MTETSPVSFQSSTEIRWNGASRPSAHPAHLRSRSSSQGPHRAARHAGRTSYARLFGDARLLGDAERTRESIDAARWMHTGDLATIDAEGYCNIVGRIKDMVIRGGENVYPREIEEFLYRHPKIQDVQVIGVPDDRYGEDVCAWVKLRPGRPPPRRHQGVLPRPDRPLQGAALRQVRRRLSDDGHRQDQNTSCASRLSRTLASGVKTA